MKRAIAMLMALSTATWIGGSTSETYVKPAAPVDRHYEAPEIPDQYFYPVMLACIAADVPVWIASRLIAVESGWNPALVNKNANGSRDIGIAQLNDRYLGEFSWRYNDGKPVDPYCVETSLRVAMRYLARLYRATGTWEGAVAAYNCGLSRYRTGDLPASTVRHVARVFGTGE